MEQADLTFAEATRGDAAQLQELIQAAFRAEDTREDWTGDMNLAAQFFITVDDITAMMDKPSSVFHMARDADGRLVGCVNVVKRGEDIGHVAFLAVDQKYHRGGLGRKVLDYAEKYCQEKWAVPKMGLNALSTRKQLLAWYMRRGYEKTGLTEPFPFDKFENLDLPEDLCFVMLEKNVR